MSAPNKANPNAESVLPPAVTFRIAESCEATTFHQRPGWRGETVHCVKPKGHDGGHAGMVEW